MAYITTSRAPGISLIERIQNFRAVAADKAAKRKVYRTTVHELSALSNRDLADLGIHRSAIKSLALEAAYGARV